MYRYYNGTIDWYIPIRQLEGDVWLCLCGDDVAERYGQIGEVSIEWLERCEVVSPCTG